MTSLETDPIFKTRFVPLTPDEAFGLFTKEFGLWWPGKSHSVSAAKGATPRTIRMEPHKGGRIIEVTDDGEVSVWGTIIGWQPGRYLSMTWHPGRPPEAATVVSVSFEPTGDGCTLTLTHGGFECLGPLADAISTSYLRGWDVVLGCYATAVPTRTRTTVP